VKLAFAVCYSLAAFVFFFIGTSHFTKDPNFVQRSVVVTVGAVFALAAWRALRMRIVLEPSSISVHRIWRSRRISLAGLVQIDFSAGLQFLSVLTLRSHGARPIRTYMISEGLSGRLSPRAKFLVDEMNQYIQRQRSN
jgi:hypothetical protein